MAALKLTETQRRRDWLIIIGASLFLLLAACLDAQALWRLPLYAAELWLLCTALYALGGEPPVPPLRHCCAAAGAVCSRAAARAAAVPVLSAPARLVLGLAAARMRPYRLAMR